MFKYPIAALLLISLTACGGSSSEKSVADNSNGASSTTSGGTSSEGVTVHITSGNGTNVVSSTISSNDTIIVGTGEHTFAPGEIYTILLSAGPNLQDFTSLGGLSAGDTIKTSIPITNSTWLAAGKTATASFDANQVVLPDPAGASLADYANYAVRTVAMESGDAAWFSFGGDTYIVENVHGEEYNFTGGTDVLVKLAGSVNLANATIVGGAVVLQ